MNLEAVKYVYMLGAGGIGMSALARYFIKRGITVAGYDRTATELTGLLEKEGVSMNYTDNEENIPERIRSKSIEGLLVVYTPAIPADSIQKNFFIRNNIPLLKRSQVLGLLSSGHPTIAVAGTHGKTTTSAMIAHLLQDTGREPVAFLGGISANYGTNYLPGGDGALMVAEADEYDRSFLQLHPQTAVITSVDPDHLDIYGSGQQLLESFAAFARLVPDNGHVIMKAGLELPVDIRSRAITYHTSAEADIMLKHCEQRNGFYHFELDFSGERLTDLSLGQPGFHNIENALAAVTAAKIHGVDNEGIRTALAGFRGVKRRFEYIIRRDDFVFIDDYAHHPEELKACIGSVKALYPDRKITGVFQPHLYSRTRDFYQGFADSLSALDYVILLDIYPARELPIPGVSSEVLLSMIRSENKLLCTREALAQKLLMMQPEVLLTLGAGDIDQLVEPIRSVFTEINRMA
jgi:UDP-N-acetylmuramate--alanine ligase